MSSLSRRQFLGTSLKLGAGAAAVGGAATMGLAGPVARAWGAPLSDALALPPPPGKVRSFVSRPDFTPPAVTVTSSRDLPAHPAYIFAAPRAVAGSGQPSGSQGLMILDLAGDLVWWRPMTSPSAAAFNFRVQSYRGRPVLTWYQGTVGFSYGIEGSGVIADSTYTEIASTYALGYGTDLHEFLITPEDTALVTAYEIVNGGKLIIGHAQEVTIGGVTAGSVKLVWDWPCYPAVAPSLSYTGPTGDYFHINSVDLWPGSARNVLISSRNTGAIYLVSRQTKQVLWRLGGRASSFAMGPGTGFSYQHDARPLPDGSGLSLFDDASGSVAEKQSWGKVLTLDASTRRATLRHEYNHATGGVQAGSQGNLQVLDTGGHLVGWGSEPYFSIFGPSGQAIGAPLLLDGRLPAGIQNYRTFAFDWTGNPPLSELAVGVLGTGSSGAFAAHVSWNGATGVSHYEVSAGKSASALKTVTGPVARKGFETRIPFTAPGATDFQVSAFGAKGQLLGRTPVVGLTT